MKKWMDELVESMDDFIVFFAEIATELAGYIGKFIILVTFPVWYLPYKFFRRRDGD